MSNSGNLGPYNLPQTVFMLSLSSNALFEQMAVPSELQSRICQFLRGYQHDRKPEPAPFFVAMNQPNSNYPSLAMAEGATVGDWQAVWGPVVYVARDSVGLPINLGATNTMYVAHSPSLQTYVVAIAGTNPTGWTAATVEDLDVGPGNMVLWPPKKNLLGKLEFKPSAQPLTDVAIDAGTADGLLALYNMVCPYTKKKLVDFLDPANLSQSGQTIVFTGHSLGGALSPSVAMLLYPVGSQWANFPANYDPNPHGGKWQNVFILATAGPTPGNAQFAEQFYSPVSPAAPYTNTSPIMPAWPPAAPAATTSGAYQPVSTGIPVPPSPPPTQPTTPPTVGAWPIRYWNMNYANAYDVVPRAWTLLANLIQQPTVADSDNYPSFFAGGEPLQGTALGGGAYDIVGNVLKLSGYNGATTTPYYAQCLQHFPICGLWGTWPTGVPYPQTFSQSNPDGPITSVDDLVNWILNAHLGQYSQMLLGYPCPGIGQAISGT